MSEIVYRALPVLAAVVLLAYLFTLLRGRKIKQRYVYLWSILALGVVVLALWPNLALRAADLVGFETAANLLLSVAAFVLLISAMSLSKAVSALEQRQERLVEDIALLEQRLREVEKSDEHSEGAAS